MVGVCGIGVLVIGIVALAKGCDRLSVSVGADVVGVGVGRGAKLPHARLGTNQIKLTTNKNRNCQRLRAQ